MLQKPNSMNGIWHDDYGKYKCMDECIVGIKWSNYTKIKSLNGDVVWNQKHGETIAIYKAYRSECFSNGFSVVICNIKYNRNSV